MYVSQAVQAEYHLQSLMMMKVVARARESTTAQPSLYPTMIKSACCTASMQRTGCCACVCSESRTPREVRQEPPASPGRSDYHTGRDRKSEGERREVQEV